MSISKQRRYGDAILLKPEKVVFEIETPMGMKEVTYGQQRSYTSSMDAIAITYRGEETWDSTVEGLQKKVQKMEDEHQEKAARDKRRKEVAKAPEEAHLYLPPGSREYRVKDDSWKGYHIRRVAGPTLVEEVHVRGHDLRSGNALVTRQDGAKEQHPWGGPGKYDYEQRSAPRATLLRPLDQHERQDVLNADAAMQKAEERRDAIKKGTRVSDVLDDLVGKEEQVEIPMLYDVETGERYAEYGGTTYRGQDAKEVTSKVIRDILINLGWTYIWDDSGCETLAEALDISSYNALAKSTEQYEQFKAADAEFKESIKRLNETLNEFLFDRSIVDPDVVNPEPVEDPDEEHVSVNVTAPDYEPDF